MTPAHGKFILDRPDGDQIVGEWSTDGKDIAVRLNGRDYRIENGVDMRSQLHWFVRGLERGDIGEPIELRACGTCQFFRVSGMALDMAHGHIGKCKLDGADVRLCYLCDSYSRLQPKSE